MSGIQLAVKIAMSAALKYWLLSGLLYAVCMLSTHDRATRMHFCTLTWSLDQPVNSYCHPPVLTLLLLAHAVNVYFCYWTSEAQGIYGSVMAQHGPCCQCRQCLILLLNYWGSRNLWLSHGTAWQVVLRVCQASNLLMLFQTFSIRPRCLIIQMHDPDYREGVQDTPPSKYLEDTAQSQPPHWHQRAFQRPCLCLRLIDEWSVHGYTYLGKSYPCKVWNGFSNSELRHCSWYSAS